MRLRRAGLMALCVGALALAVCPAVCTEVDHDHSTAAHPCGGGHHAPSGKGAPGKACCLSAVAAGPDMSGIASAGGELVGGLAATLPSRPWMASTPLRRPAPSRVDDSTKRYLELERLLI